MSNFRLQLVQILATREAGSVERCHIQPHFGSYNNAQHCYGVANLILLLHPNPSMNLVRAALWHDLAERWVGDIPATAKWSRPELGRACEQAEEDIRNRLEMNPQLSQSEKQWLKFADMMELWLWCREQERLGNRAITEMKTACVDVLKGYMETWPGEFPEGLFSTLLKKIPVSMSLSDDFDRVERIFRGFEKTGN